MTETLSPRALGLVVIALVATAVLTGVDLGTKKWALDTLSTERTTEPPPACTQPGFMQRRPVAPITLIEHRLEFRYQENCGAAFGFMRNASPTARKGVFYAAATGAIVLLGWMFITGRGGRLFTWSVPFVLAGAIGNLVDRVNLGYVVDFIRFYWGQAWSYPTFNVADIWITVGVALILLDGIFEGRAEKRRAQAASKA